MTLVVGLPSQAHPQPRDLDQGFGVRGKAVAALDFGNPKFWYAVHVLAAHTPNGRILVAGNNSVLRYLPSGRLDRRFAENGVLQIENVEGANKFELRGLAVDSKDRIIAAGTAESPQETRSAAILRFNPGGTVDPTFGGDGALVTDFAVPFRSHPPLPWPSFKGPWIQVTGVAVDSEDRIVVSGSAAREWGYCNAVESGFVGRIDPQGNADSSFGEGGVAVYEPTRLGSAQGVVLDSTGAPLSFGRGYSCRESPATGSTVDRLEINGSPSSAFGREGLASVRPYPRGIALDGLGRIVVMERWRVQRLLPSGNLDRRFGKGGTTRTLLRGKWSGLDDLAVAQNGDMLLTGHQVHYFGKREPRRRLVLLRLNPHGMLDRHFGDGGVVKTRFGRPSNTVGRQVLLDGKGHAVVGGTVRNRRLLTGAGLALFRYDLKP